MPLGHYTLAHAFMIDTGCAAGSPSPGGGASRATRAGWGEREASLSISPHPDRFRHSASKTRVNALMVTAVDPPPPGKGGPATRSAAGRPFRVRGRLAV